MTIRPTKKALHDHFRMINQLFFGGVLPPVAIHWRRMRGYGLSEEPTPRHPLGLICLSTGEMPPCGWQGVMLHEAIHLRLDMDGIDEGHEGTVPHHGPIFTAECNRIGAILGLEEVEIEDSWAWPYSNHYSEVEPCADEG